MVARLVQYFVLSSNMLKVSRSQVPWRLPAAAVPVSLTPLAVHSRSFFVPLDNKVYQVGRQLGVLTRPAYLWTKDVYEAKLADAEENAKPLCQVTKRAHVS